MFESLFSFLLTCNFFLKLLKKSLVTGVFEFVISVEIMNGVGISLQSSGH
jgi:hypothetical protein